MRCEPNNRDCASVERERRAARSRRLPARRKLPRKKSRSIGCATEPICSERSDPAVGIASASPIGTTMLPNAWTFGVYVDGELCSSIRISVLTSEWRMSCSAELFGDMLHPELDRGRSHHRSGPLRRRSRTRPSDFPELPYLTVRLAYMACEHFNADIGLAIVRAEHQAFYRRVFLHETIARTAPVSGRC